MDADRLARWYRWIEHAAFGRALERSRFTFLHRLAGARRVLVLGEGDGRTLQRLLAIAPHAQFDVLESSAKMIALARRRIEDSSRVRWHCQDALAVALPLAAPQAAYDGVVTCFFLDCFSEAELRDLLPRVEAALQPGATWLLSEFRIPQSGWRRWHAMLWIKVMYGFFRITTGLRTQALAPIQELLSEFGMHSVAVEQRRWGMIVSEVLEYQPRLSNVCRLSLRYRNPGLADASPHPDPLRSPNSVGREARP